MFATVAVLRNIPSSLTYAIPEAMRASACIGRLVVVPVKNKLSPGIIIEVSATPPLELRGDVRFCELKSIAPYPPLFDDNYLKYIKFIANYYSVSIGLVLASAFPNLGKIKLKESFYLKEERPLDPVISTIKKKKIHTFKQLSKHFPDLTLAQVNELESSGVIEKSIDISFKTFSPKELDCFDVVDEHVFSLDREQETILSKMLSSVNKNIYYLLHGKTGSGKTELLINLASKILQQNMSVLYLVPEISIVPHIYRRASSVIPTSSIVVWHSSLSNNIRGYELEKIQRTPVFVIGTRSSIFLPAFSCGLIIVDEEHDGSYKQEGVFAYNARDLAIMRGKLFSHPVVLSSATPCIESFYRASRREYVYTALSARYTPQRSSVQVVDTRSSELIDGFFSKPLLEAIQSSLDNNKQSLIFINRRGYVPFLYCSNCKKFVLCKSCNVPLTWHKSKNAFLCHRCSHIYPALNYCPTCKQSGLSFWGAGTERITELLSRRFLKAQILKIDRDDAENPNFFKHHLRKIIDGTYDIIVGTQIISKGHHFPHLAFVGVLLGEQGLSMPDFRAQERSFQILTQVAGRAGREMPGSIIIQTTYPDAPSISYALAEDYDGFFSSELSLRQQTLFPPFVRLLLVKILARSEEIAREGAEKIYAAMLQWKKPPGVIIHNPMPAPIAKERGYYRYQIFVKAQKPQHLMTLVKSVKGSVRLGSGVRLNFDMDPYNVL